MVGGANGQSSAASPPDAHGRVCGSQGGLLLDPSVSGLWHRSPCPWGFACGVPRRRGYLCGRRLRSKWAANEIPGIHCGGDDWLPHYVAHIHQSGLFDQLEEMEGMTLVCDCPMEVPCKADILIGLLFERRLQSGEPGRASGSVSRRRPRRAALAAWGGIPQALPRNLQKHSQESLVARFRRLFPHE